MKTLFVSSTFKDMQFERDAIQEIALPKLNSIAHDYGQTLSFCDLRWGINTLDLDSEEGSKKVLDVCLDSIDRSSPPMIVLLGDRYGYIPDSELIRGVARGKNFDLEQAEISVTALEIEYGALPSDKKQKTLFYFRELSGAPDEYKCEDKEHAQKLAELKSRIYALCGGRCRTYKAEFKDGKLDGMREFAEMLVADVAEMLLPEWKEQAMLSPFERERKTQWDFIEDRNAICRGRDAFLKKVISAVNGGSKTVALKGEAGSGKSVIFSALACALRSEGWDVLPFVGGLTVESNDAFDIIRNTVLYLKHKLHGAPPENTMEEMKEKNPSDWRRLAGELIDEYCSSGKRFAVMVDAVDQLLADDFRNSLSFIPETTVKGFCFVTTCNDDFNKLDAGSITVKPLTAAEKTEVIKGTLGRYGRELDKTVVDDMVRLDGSGNSLYLCFLIKRLLMMNKTDFDSIASGGGDMTAISAYQRRLIAECPNNADDMCALLLDEAGKRINEKLVGDVLKCLACARFGLRVSDLQTIIGEEWNALDFAHFIAYMGDCFILRDDGRYDFSHKSIRQGLLKDSNIKSYHLRIAWAFSQMPSDDIANTEIIYHLIQADAKPQLRAFLSGSLVEASKSGTEMSRRFTVVANSICKFVECDDGEWFASVLDDTPNTEPYLPFAVVMYFVAVALASTNSAPKAALRFNTALMELCSRMEKNGISEAAELVQGVRLFLGQAHLTANNDGDAAQKQYADAFDIAKQKLDADMSDENILMALLSLRGKILAKSEPTEEDLEQMLRIAECAEKRYDTERNAATVRNFYLYKLTFAIMCATQNNNVRMLLEQYDAADIADGNIALFTADHELDIQTMVEAAVAFGSICVSLCQNAVFALSQCDLYNSCNDDDDDYDDEEIDDDDGEYDLDDGNDDDPNYADIEQFILRKYVENGGEAFDLDEFVGGDEYDDDDEYNDDEYDDEDDDDDIEDGYRAMFSNMVKAGVKTLNTVLLYAEHALKLGLSQYAVPYCTAEMNLGSLAIFSENYDDARKYLSDALARILEYEKTVMSVETRQIEFKIRATLLGVTEGGLDAKLNAALSLAHDAENLAAGDMSTVGVSMLGDAYTAVLSTLIEKVVEQADTTGDYGGGARYMKEIKHWREKLGELAKFNVSADLGIEQLCEYADNIIIAIENDL